MKDALEEDPLSPEAAAEVSTETPLRRVTMEDAARYLALQRENAPKMALAAFLCVLSPICLLFLAICLGGTDMLYALSVCALLIIAGLGAMLFVLDGTYYGALDKLLEEGDYTRCSKVESDFLMIQRKKKYPPYGRGHTEGHCFMSAARKRLSFLSYTTAKNLMRNSAEMI